MSPPTLFNPYRFVTGSAIGGWKELDRDELTGTSDTITVSGFASKPYLLNLGFTIADGGVINASLRMGNGSVDAGANYAYRKSLNFGADSTATNQNEIVSDSIGANLDEFKTTWISNYASTEKSTIALNVSNDGRTTSTETTCCEVVGKWDDATNQADEFQIYKSTGGGAFGAESISLLLGYDGADADTGGFFEELADSGAASGSALELDSGTFTPKRFLFFEISNNGNSTGNDKQFRFNSDSGSNYCWRGQTNNTSVSTAKGETATRIGLDQNTDTASYGFIYNATDYVKIGMCWGIKNAGTATDQTLYTFKWVNTVDQITSIQLRAEGVANIGAGTVLKVWGGD